MRWLWIDRFVDFQTKRCARAVKNLSLSEDLFIDHFPGYPVFPAPLMLEGLAQTGGILVGEANDYREKVVLAKIVSSRFTREVLAGETLVYDAELLHLREEGASVAGRIHSLPPGGSLDSTPGEFIGEAEIFFAHLDK